MWMWMWIRCTFPQVLGSGKTESPVYKRIDAAFGDGVKHLEGAESLHLDLEFVGHKFPRLATTHCGAAMIDA